MSRVATTHEEYKAVLAERRAAYTDYVKADHIDLALRRWAERMEAKEGPTVKVWHNELPWLEALMVVRYGEAIEHWPLFTTVADHGRALEWEAGKAPEAVIAAATMKLDG